MARPDNAALSELLCIAADEPDRSYQQRRALRRAGRGAYRWAIEAADLVAEERSLTELRLVGPWLARVLGEWIADPPVPMPEPPPIRRGFLTAVEAHRVLETTPAPRVRGDLQMHTEGSDGKAPVGAMADAARALGHEYVAITDHSKGLTIAHGMDERALARQGEAIDALNDALAPRGPRILRAVELNVSPHGAVDLEPSFLRGLDLRLGAFHSRLRLTDDQTERYLAALRNPDVDVLAHPRGRIFNFRLGLSADWARVFEYARAHDRAVEIDAHPDRQDLDGALLALARETGVRISIGSDAHAPGQLEFLDYGVAAARRARIPADRILNCMPVDDLLAWAREHRAHHP
ncbi:MAG TPA: PHP domain-containing protein [Candidatus Binatia bacterium]